jgi:hypothetical protein
MANSRTLPSAFSYASTMRFRRSVWYGFMAPAARARTVPLGAAEQAQSVPDPYENCSKNDLPEPNRAKLVELLDGRLADVEAHLQAES